MRAALRGDGAAYLADDVPVPAPGPTEVLVHVRASSLNRADLALFDGRQHGPHGGAGTPLGLEWAGDVVQVGSQVQGFHLGDSVMCSGVGGFAEYAVADWRRCFPAQGLDIEKAACLPISLRTTHVALVSLGRLAPGENVLVLGASSGVGLMALQVARLRGAGLVIGTSTQADRRARLAEFGADVVLDTGAADWWEQVLHHTQGRGVDLVVDFLGGPFLNPAMRATALGGRIVNVGRMAGDQAQVDLDLHSLRRIQYLGTTFRTRSADEVAQIQEQVRTDFWPALMAGKLGVPIDVRLPLERFAEACEMMRANRHFGKIVLRPGGE